MLKLPKGLKKKKKKSKKDQELFTEEELEQYKRELKAKQEAAAAKSDAGESDAASDVEGLASTSASIQASLTTSETTKNTEGNTNEISDIKNPEKDEEWAKFKALTSGVDSILHKTQDELDRIKKESFYQRLPSAAEKKRQEEEEAAQRELARIEEEKRKAAEREAQRDKLAEAVVQLSDSGEEDIDEIDDIFATDYIEAITSGEVQLAVVPDSPLDDFAEGPDPFDTAYAEKVIVGADKAKGNKKLVSLGAAVEVLSGRVDREHALALAKPKRKLRKGIQNLLLSESVDLADGDIELSAPEPQRNLLDDLVSDVPEPEQPIDLSVSLHLHLIQTQKADVNEEEHQHDQEIPDLSEFDTLYTQEDDEFAELAAESLTKKDEIQKITEIPKPKAEVITDLTDSSWAEFEPEPEEPSSLKAKPVRPPPPTRPTSGPHIVEGAIYISDDEDLNAEDDIFNTSYAEQVIKKTTVLEEDDDFDPRAEEQRDVVTVSQHLSANFDPFDTSAVCIVVESNTIAKPVLTDLNHSLSDPDFNPRSNETVVVADVDIQSAADNFETARRKSSLSLNLQSKTVGFVVSDRDLLGASNENCGNKKPLTPFYAPTGADIIEKESDDPFDTSFVPDVKPTEVELKHLEQDLLQKFTLKQSVSDPDFNPRAPSTPEPPEDLLSVKDNINIKVLTPAQESKDLPDDDTKILDPFDTSIASDLKPGAAELKVIENELLPPSKSDIAAGVLDTQTDAQELGLGDKVLTPSIPNKQETLPEEIDPFDTSIAANLAPGETEIKLLVSELIDD